MTHPAPAIFGRFVYGKQQHGHHLNIVQKYAPTADKIHCPKWVQVPHHATFPHRLRVPFGGKVVLKNFQIESLLVKS